MVTENTIEDIINNKIEKMVSNKPIHETLVVVAMSGGIDSSVCAVLLKYLGYKVIGITLQLYNGSSKESTNKSCCAGQDIEDAKHIAMLYNFPHYVFNYENIFKKSVIDDFVNSYLQGETPIPCVRCNQSVKFNDLLSSAKKLGADVLVTGHYIRRIINNVDGAVEMHTAIDNKKDQSYFLFATTKEQLNYLRFPLGNFTKDITRKIAEYFKLHISKKPDSQDICFVGDSKYKDVIKNLSPASIIEGDIMHINGNILGKHNGIINYTIGQRRGLNVSASKPLYVIDIDTKNRNIIVGPKEYLLTHSINIKELNWLGNNQLSVGSKKEVTIKIRSNDSSFTNGILEYTGDYNAVIHLYDEHYKTAKGQACVLYNDTKVLGGGWITNN